MANNLAIFINDAKVLDYNKNTRLPGKQWQMLDAMDLDMDEGIELDDNLIDTPDKMQRANYVAMNLLYGIEKNNERMISATCGYLASRLPELKIIKAVENGNEITMELIFNQAN